MKLGRLARTDNRHVPLLHLMMDQAALPPLVPEVDHAAGMPDDLGAMLNHELDNCTCAAFYHALQVWSWNTCPTDPREMQTEPDDHVRRLYELACGYNPDQGSPGPHGSARHVLTYVLQHGAPCGPDGNHRQKIVAFVEIDVANLDHIRHAIHTAGLVYFGFDIPRYILPVGGQPPALWDVQAAADNSIAGGHAVILTGYDDAGARFISWGRHYTMTWAFFQQFADEAYAMIDPKWFSATGRTPGGLTLQQLEASMQALKARST
jgi:hypothetical protein